MRRCSGEILIAGLGSIGRRHLRNLQSCGWPRIRLYRTGHATLPDDDLAGLAVEHDLDAALACRPLAVIVANPTALHLPVALAAARAGAHLLIEKPISHTLAGLELLEAEVAARGLVGLVGFQFRFHPALQQVKAWIDAGAIGTVVSAQAHWGEYLPDMHPWEDFRRGYAARPDLGGGVTLTLSHPFDYLRWLIGEVREVTATAPAHAALDLDVDAATDIALGFDNGASGQVHLDFVQRPPDHRLTIIGTEGTITWCQADQVARRFSPQAGQWEAVPPPAGFERNCLFADEMKHFLACIHGDEVPACTLADGRAALEIALAVRTAVGRPA